MNQGTTFRKLVLRYQTEVKVSNVRGRNTVVSHGYREQSQVTLLIYRSTQLCTILMSRLNGVL